MQPLFKLQASQVCRRFYLPPESMQEECWSELWGPGVEVMKLTFAGCGTLFFDSNWSQILGPEMQFFTIFWAQMKLWSVVQEVECVAGLSALLNPHHTCVLGIIAVKYYTLVNMT